MRRWFQKANPGVDETSQATELAGESRRRRRIDIGVALLITLMLHALLIPVVNYYMKPVERDHSQPRKIHVRLVPKKSSGKKSARKDQEKLDKMPQKQIVSTAEPVQKERPEKTDYISEFDHKVDRNTKSSITAPHENISDRPQQGKVRNPRQSKEEVPEQKAGLPKLSETSENRRQPRNLAKESLDQKAIGRSPQRDRQKKSGGGEAIDQFKGGKDQINLVPSWRELERYAGMPFNDHLEDVEEDAQTRLNTFEWKHATFFNRIKEGVSRVWAPIAQIRRYDPEGTLLGRRDRLTVVTVSIDREGNLVNVKIKTPSGVHYLDDEAMRAFRVAGPFPNPPKAIFGSDDTFSFPFGFHVGYEKGVSLDFDWRPY